MLQRAQSYYGMLNILLLLVTAYTVREETIHKWLPWMTFPIFLGTVLLVMIAVMVLDHKLIYPSLIAFHQDEAWKHMSPVKSQFDKLDARLSGIEDALGIQKKPGTEEEEDGQVPSTKG